MFNNHLWGQIWHRSLNSKNGVIPITNHFLKLIYRKRRAPTANVDEAGKPQDGADGEVLLSGPDGEVFGRTTSDSAEWKGYHLQDVPKITATPSDSQYLLIIGVKFLDDKSNAELKIIMHGPKGYLSAHEYPLLNFYMVRK